MTIAVIMAAAIAFQGAQQFDLICTGTESAWGADQVVRTHESNARARIDLERNLWCWDGCQSVFTINKVDDAEITLMDRPTPNGGKSHITVNRITGAYVSNIVIRGGFEYDTMITGTCRPAEYTPIPQAAF